jgi:hypothetical protein
MQEHESGPGPFRTSVRLAKTKLAGLRQAKDNGICAVLPSARRDIENGITHHDHRQLRSVLGYRAAQVILEWRVSSLSVIRGAHWVLRASARVSAAVVQFFPSAAMPSRMCSVWANPAASRFIRAISSGSSLGPGSFVSGSVLRMLLVGPFVR